MPASYTFLFSQASNLLSIVAKEPHCLYHAITWFLDICSTQPSPLHRFRIHIFKSRHQPHNNTSVHLTTTTTEMRRSRQFKDGMEMVKEHYGTPYFHPRYRHPPSWNDPVSLVAFANDSAYVQGPRDSATCKKVITSRWHHF